MTKPRWTGPGSLYGSITGLGVALAFSCNAFAADPNTGATPAADITREYGAKLPPGRDLAPVLDLHNRARAEVGSLPLQWSSTLAEHAQDYANILAQTGALKHSSRVGRENERENLALGLRNGNTPVRLARTWLDERQFFRAGVFPDVCAGDWSLCAHYTQMIWSTTTDLGCGFASGTYDVLVCRYSPPGNRDGRQVIALRPPEAAPAQK